MKKHFGIIILLVLLSFLLSSCENVSFNSEVAIGVAEFHTNKKATFSFSLYSGKKEYILNAKDNSRLKYTGKIEEGSAIVYIDCDGEKKELYTIHSLEEIDSTFELKAKGSIIITIETTEKMKKGKFTFEIV